MKKMLCALFLLCFPPVEAMSRLIQRGRQPTGRSFERVSQSALRPQRSLFSGGVQRRVPSKWGTKGLVGAGIAGGAAGIGLGASDFFKDSTVRVRRMVFNKELPEEVEARNKGFIDAFNNNDAKQMQRFLALGIDPDTTYGALGSFHMGPHTLLEGVIWAKRPTELLKVILDAGADPNRSSSDYTSTPLIAAFINKDYDAMKLLVERGADVHKRNKAGKYGFMTKSPLERARYFNDQKALNILLGKDTGVGSAQSYPDQVSTSLANVVYHKNPYNDPRQWLYLDESDDESDVD